MEGLQVTSIKFLDVNLILLMLFVDCVICLLPSSA
jgi:hypothetical protein